MVPEHEGQLELVGALVGDQLADLRLLPGRERPLLAIFSAASWDFQYPRVFRLSGSTSGYRFPWEGR